MFDHYTDVEDAKGCRAMADIVVDALQHPFMPRPKGEANLGEITRRSVSTGAWLQRLIDI